MISEEKDPKLLLGAIWAYHRAEQDSFSELSFAFGHGHFCDASKRAGTRDSCRVSGRIWYWALKRWKNFPQLEYREINKHESFNRSI